MLVNDVMSAPALTVPPDAPVALAVTMLNQHAITMLPVIDGNRRLVGVVSEYDVAREVLPGVVGELMTRHPSTVHTHTDLAVATDLMTTAAVQSLPVLDDQQRVVGVVSRRDIAHSQPDRTGP